MASAPTLLVYGIVFGATIALIAIGFALIYGVLKFIDFSHTDRLTISGYVFIYFAAKIGVIPAIILSCVSAMFLAVFTETFIFHPLRSKGPTVLMINSFGLSIILQAAMALGLGSALQVAPIEEFPISSSIKLYPRELIVLLLVPIIIIFLQYWLHRTGQGVSLRALVDDYEKALLFRVPVRLLSRIAFAISGILAGIGGISISIAFGIFPSIGFKLLIFAFSACIIGGIGSLWGAVIASFLLGIVITFAEAWGSSLAAEGIALMLLVLVLILKPQGILGSKLREF